MKISLTIISLLTNHCCNKLKISKARYKNVPESNYSNINILSFQLLIEGNKSLQLLMKENAPSFSKKISYLNTKFHLFHKLKHLLRWQCGHCLTDSLRSLLWIYCLTIGVLNLKLETKVL